MEKNFSGWMDWMEKNTPILVYFEDGERTSCKSGKFLKQDDKFLHLKIGETTHSINRIVRVESTGVSE